MIYANTIGLIMIVTLVAASVVLLVGYHYSLSNQNDSPIISSQQDTQTVSFKRWYNLQQCVSEGYEGNTFKSQRCCTNLTAITDDSPNQSNTPSCLGATKNGDFVCAQCGNGVCGNGENRCNCPADCK